MTVRAYWVTGIVAFGIGRLAEDALRIFERTLGERLATARPSPGRWCSDDDLATALDALAVATGPAAAGELRACGRAVGEAAYDGFLGNALDAMDGALFFRKLPVMWALDRGDSAGIAVGYDGLSSGQASVRLSGSVLVPNFSTAYLGWLEHALSRVDVVGSEIELDLSERPGATSDGVLYRASWSHAQR